MLLIVKILQDCCRNTNKTHSGVLPWTFLGLHISLVSAVFEFHSTAGHRGFRPQELVLDAWLIYDIMKEEKV